MIEPVLQRQLEPIIERRRGIRAFQVQTGVFVFVAAFALLALWLGKGTLAWWWLPFAGWLIAAPIGYFIKRRPLLDVRELAREIEADNPDLKALLLTAVEEEKRAGEKELGFMQERLFKEAAEKAIASRWRDNVDSEKERGWKVAQLASAVAVVVAMTILTFSMGKTGLSKRGETAGVEEKPQEVAADEFEFTVEPGDVEIEQGGRLLVSARFGERVPAGVRLETMLGETGRTIEMEQSLSDPVFVATQSQVNADGTYRIAFEGGASEEFKITTYVLPVVESTDAAISPPPGIDLPVKEIEDTRRVSVMEGSGLTLKIHTNKEVASGKLVPDGEGETIPLRVDSENGYLVAEFKPEADAKMSIHLVDADGRENRRPPLFRIDVRRNLPSKIELAFPGGDAEVTPIQEIAAEATLWDDVKLIAAGASYQFGGKEFEVPFETVSFKPDKKNPVGTMLEFEKLGASPNDLLTYFFWAEDIGPDGAPRRVQSDMRFIEVRHFEEIFRETPNQGGEGQQGEGGGAQQSEELLAAQKEIMNATWKLRRQSAAGRKDLGEDIAVIAEGQSAVIEKAAVAANEITDAEMMAHLEEAMNEMRSAVEVLSPVSEDPFADNTEAVDLAAAMEHEQKAYAALLRMRAREFQVTLSNQQQSSSSSSSSQRQQRQLMNMELKQEEKRYETQRFAEEQQQEQRQQENREDVQILNRLKELARRQEGITDKIQELQAMLEEAETEEEREEIKRELERLEQEQRSLVEDLDELNERMQSEENISRTAEAREQLEEAREDAQNAAKALENEQLDQAANAGTRAEEEFEELAEEFRERTSNRFAEEVRDARRQARDLAEREREIADQLAEKNAAPEPIGDTEIENTLENAALAADLEDQRKEFEDLLDNLRELSETAEESEPVLSRKLFDSVREAEADQVDTELENAGQFTRFNRLADAAEFERTAREGIEELEQNVDAAAEGILGDETAALRMARSEVEELLREVEESERARGEVEGEQSGEGQQPNEGQQPSEGQQPGGVQQPGEDQQRDQGQEPDGGQQPNPNGQPGEGQRPGESEEPVEGQQGSEGLQPGEEQQSGEGQEPSEGQQRGEGQQPGESQEPGEGQQPREGERPGAGQQTREGEQPGEGEQSGEGQQPSEGQQPGGGQQPNEGQQPGEGQRPGEGQQPGESQQPGEGQQPGGGQQHGEGQPRAENQQPGEARPTDTPPRFFDQWGGAQAGGGTHSRNQSGESPIYGDAFREWSDRLRDVEEMIEDEEIQQDVARIRDRAREMRRDFNRHSTVPNQALVDLQITTPLTELRDIIDEELAKREKPDSRLPLDRDPVPGAFEELVRDYYERIGSGE